MYRYSLNFDKIIKHYLSVWYKPVRFAWLSSLASPLAQTATDTFVTFRAQAIELARYNGQTIILESILNKALNTGNKTAIYIKNSDQFINSTFLHNESENYADLFLFNEGSGPAVYLFDESEFNQIYSFIVYVPTAIYNTSLSTIKAWVNRYKIGGTTYNIIPY